MARLIRPFLRKAAGMWKLCNTRFWSAKRPAHTLHEITGEWYRPLHWRRVVSRPGWFIAFVRYEPRDRA